MLLTPEGEEFIGYAENILKEIEEVEHIYRYGAQRKQRFSISVPRACYISDAFAEFSRSIDSPAEIFYKETNSQRTINNVLNNDYKLGIIRYAESYDRMFKDMLEEKGLHYEMVSEFTYSLIMSEDSPLAALESIGYDDLAPYIEIAHADPYVPSLPLSKVVKEELPDNTDRRIFIFERASQFDLLSMNNETFMWVSPTPEDVLRRYRLVTRPCRDNERVYKDVLIYREGYKLTRLDNMFITALIEARRKHFK